MRFRRSASRSTNCQSRQSGFTASSKRLAPNKKLRRLKTGRASMDLGLKGKIALVTGATSGVGREIALRLAAEGALLAVNYRGSAADAELIVKEIESKGGNAK